MVNISVRAVKKLCFICFWFHFSSLDRVASLIYFSRCQSQLRLESKINVTFIVTFKTKLLKCKLGTKSCNRWPRVQVAWGKESLSVISYLSFYPGSLSMSLSVNQQLAGHILIRQSLIWNVSLFCNVFNTS